MKSFRKMSVTTKGSRSECRSVHVMPGVSRWWAGALCSPPQLLPQLLFGSHSKDVPSFQPCGEMEVYIGLLGILLITSLFSWLCFFACFSQSLRVGSYVCKARWKKEWTLGLGAPQRRLSKSK
jgi:hypothetical protein